jgi:3-methyladenine DNA glycosylase AlkD
MEMVTPLETARQFMADLQTLPQRNTPSVRVVRRRYSAQLKQQPAGYVLDVARALLRQPERKTRWMAYELVTHHRPARQELNPQIVVELGQGMDSWDAVDTFGACISGPAWREGRVPDELIYEWAQSDDRWWRRAALVTTTELNKKSHGGKGDSPRTLAVCRLLVSDRDDMVVKALSWALRELVPWDAPGVAAFLEEHQEELAPRVKREVRNKLETGLKNPRR